MKQIIINLYLFVSSVTPASSPVMSSSTVISSVVTFSGGFGGAVLPPVLPPRAVEPSGGFLPDAKSQTESLSDTSGYEVEQMKGDL